MKLTQIDWFCIKKDYLNGLDGVKIARKWNVDSSSIYRVLSKMGVKRRTHWEYKDMLKEKGKKISYTLKKLFSEGKLKLSWKKDLPEKEIVYMYKEKKISIYKIAEIFGCSAQTINNLLKRNSIERYPRGFLIRGKPSWQSGLTKEKDDRVKKYANSLKKYYYNNKNPRCGFKKGIVSWNIGLSKETDERIKTVAENNCISWDERFGKERAKKMKERISKRVSGEKHPLFNNWASLEPYGKEFNNKFKRKIRKRDNQVCMLCGIHKEKLTRALSIHHINYDKKLNIPPNLVSLCLDCHLKTNTNRTHWTKFFQSLLSDRYGYKYDEVGNVIIELNPTIKKI